MRRKVEKMAGGGRPRSIEAIVDKALANLFSIEHYDLAHSSFSTLKDKAKENWGVFTKGFKR